MAIYTTFFLCNPSELPGGFPGWRPPLPQPVKREFKSRITGQTSIIETQVPDWNDQPSEDPEAGRYVAMKIEGSYEDYLQARLPPFVRSQPHWCTKGLTDIELTPLAEALGVVPAMETALYCRPSLGAVLQQFRPDFVSKLTSLDDSAAQKTAQAWAGTMSTPKHTHTRSGKRLYPDWTAAGAIAILRPLIALAKQSDGKSGMYVLIEP
jgi:hypothetical protein